MKKTQKSEVNETSCSSKGSFWKSPPASGHGPRANIWDCSGADTFRRGRLLLLGWSKLTLLSILFLLLLKEALQGQGARSSDSAQEAHSLVGKETETQLTRIYDIFFDSTPLAGDLPRGKHLGTSVCPPASDSMTRT